MWSILTVIIINTGLKSRRYMLKSLFGKKFNLWLADDLEWKQDIKIHGGFLNTMPLIFFIYLPGHIIYVNTNKIKYTALTLFIVNETGPVGTRAFREHKNLLPITV